MTDAPYEPMLTAAPSPWPVTTAGPPRRFVGSIAAATAVAFVVAALGAGIGWLWADLAPRVAVIKAEQGFLYADSEPEQAVAGDGWFAILGAAAGLLFAVAAWYVLRRYRGPALLLGLTLGSLAGALLAWWVGYKIGMAEFTRVSQSAAMGARLDAPLGLRITDLRKSDGWIQVPNGVGAVQALVAAAVYSVLAGFSAFPDLRGDPLPVPMYVDPVAYRDPSDDAAAPEAEPHQDSEQQLLSATQPTRQQPPSGTVQRGEGQFGPGFTGSSDNTTGTART